MRHSCWIAVAIASTTASADGLHVTLASDTSDTHVVMVDHPADTSGNTVLVAWDHMAGKVDTGAMVFRRERGTDEVRYFAIGHGSFSIVDRGGKALSAGTSVPVFDLVTDDPAHPAALRVVAGQTIDVPALIARYETFEHVVASGGRTAVDAAIAAQLTKTTKACGHAPAVDVAWDPFKKAGKLELASQAVAIYEALELMCADADYRKAVGKLTKLHVAYRAEGALELAVAGSTLSATVSPTSFDPREVAAKWLHDNL